MLAFVLALAGDFLGGYALLRLTRRWWLLLPGALLIGIASGLIATIGLGWLVGVLPGRAVMAGIKAASSHALLSVACIFWLRWWLTPMR